MLSGLVADFQIGSAAQVAKLAGLETRDRADLEVCATLKAYPNRRAGCMDPEISIVVPLRNESPNVLPLTRQILAALRSETRPIELVLVDDGSTDGTWDQILEAGRIDRRVRSARHQHGAGQSAALWTGFRLSRGNVIATLDGDLQNDPADLPRLLAELANCDLVCGVRTKRADSLLRRLSSSIAGRARKFALGSNFQDTGCNLRAFKRSVLQAVPAFDGAHRFMPILAQGGGAIVRQVPVAHHPRPAGQSKYGVWNRLWRGIRDLLMVRLYLRRQINTMAPIETSEPS